MFWEELKLPVEVHAVGIPGIGASTLVGFHNPRPRRPNNQQAAIGAVHHVSNHVWMPQVALARFNFQFKAVQSSLAQFISMKMKCWVLVIFLVVIIQPISVRSQNEKEILLINQTNLDYDFYYHDSLCFGKPVKLFKKSRAFLKINYPILLFEANWNQIPYLLFPGDTLFVKKDEGKFTKLATRHNKIRNAELNFFKELVKSTGMIRYILASETPIKHSYSLSKRDSVIEKLYKARNGFLDRYTKEHPVSQGFIDFCKTTFESYRIKEKISLRANFYTRGQLKKYYAGSQPEYIQYLTTDSLMWQFPYRETGLALMNFLVDNDEFATRFQETNHYFQGNMKDFLLTRILFDEIKLHPFRKDDSLILYAKNFIVSGNYSSQLKKFLSSASEPDSVMRSNNQLELMNPEGKYFSFKELMDENKNTVVYIDFWASWCMPCRKEMIQSRRLQKELRNTNITFVFLSTDENKENWLKAMAEEKIESKNSYLIIKKNNGIIYNLFDLSTIPKYAIINKDGQVVFYDAPRPSEAKTKEILKKMAVE